MSATAALKPGAHVLVPWGVGKPRAAVILEVWGDPTAPSYIRVQLEPDGPEDSDSAVLLLGPELVTLAA